MEEGDGVFTLMSWTGACSFTIFFPFLFSWLTLFLSYGATEVEAVLNSMVGEGSTVLVISPAGTTESATNPEYTITNAMLATFTPINATVGELGTVDVTFTGGTWARDVTTP